MEEPLRRFGYKPIIILGGLLVAISLGLFPLWKSFWFWFVLRLIIGIGDHALHFGTQTWITTTSSEKNRGRNVSLYGLFFGVGFAAGPLMTPLITIHEALPFILSSALCFIGWLLLFLLKNDYPEQTIEVNSLKETMKRFGTAWKYGWVAFLPPLGYGFLESSLNGSFPIYGLRIGIDLTNISILLFSFAIGGILFQLPLGMISDKFGRKTILMSVLFIGVVSFTFASFVEDSIQPLTACLFIAGMAVGSTFSLGISYMSDLMPKNLLPTGNLLCGIAFSVGSLLGPYLGGMFIAYTENISYFLIISSMLLAIFIAITAYRPKYVTQIEYANEKAS